MKMFKKMCENIERQVIVVHASLRADERDSGCDGTRKDITCLSIAL